MKNNEKKRKVNTESGDAAIFDALTGELYYLISRMTIAEKVEMFSFAKKLLDRCRGKCV